MKVPMVKKRLPDGTLGPLEPAFPEMVGEIDETTLLMLNAIVGMQEQIDALKTEIETAKGGGE
ncbi:hypothetical protein H7992_07245 [Sporosarcina sp. resist]|uniref:hypothetical protein n=1 Tax=Sporosarcina sp. resist TaxID=2762563 RepID=UPI00164D8A02|nr:hypothetical protein [Sporosarcina sp. resist]QNK89453.1 hypothetical protein H7992_07245 [Sporosarcina sp. resist]